MAIRPVSPYEPRVLRTITATDAPVRYAAPKAQPTFGQHHPKWPRPNKGPLTTLVNRVFTTRARNACALWLAVVGLPGR